MFEILTNSAADCESCKHFGCFRRARFRVIYLQ